MKLREARLAITAILESIETSELPKPRKEKRETETIYWFGGHGYHLGATSAGVRDPGVHRRFGITEMLQGERIARIDAADMKKKAAQS